MKLGYVIAIDGPSGAGKSTLARELARRLGYNYIDTGAMYRAAALAASRQGVALEEGPELREFLRGLRIRQESRSGTVHTLVGEEDVSEAIRTAEMGMKASEISALPSVRERMLVLQREMGAGGGVVLEGRDIGTVVFPGAEIKFYLDATVEERARRRYDELRSKGYDGDLDRILSEIQKRDRNDSTRAIAPLRCAADARVIDSTAKSIDEVVAEMMQAVAVGSEGKD